MAEETIQIIRIETGDAVRSVSDLKENIKTLKDRLGDLEIGTDEYQETLKELKLNQNALKDAMYATTSSMDDVAASAKGATDSYNSLVHKMAELKEEFRSTNDEARRNELGKQIKDINDRLKAMDKSIGNFQRNVGNYASAVDGLAGSFSSVAGGASSVINPIKNVTAGLTTLSANPVVGILGLLANILNQIISNLKTSEENLNATTSAMSVFSGAADMVKNTMQVLGKAVAKVADVLGNLALKIFPKLREAAELQNEIRQEEIALSFKQREAVQKNADAELELAKLRAKAADKDKYTAQERIKYLEAAMALELQVSKRSKEIAEQEYQIQLLKSKTAENSKEENDALAQAYANKVKAETDYFNKTRELTSQIISIKKEEKTASEKAIKEEEKAKQRMIEINKSLWQVRLESAVKGSEDEYTTRQAILEDEYLLEKMKAQSDIKDADEKVKTLEVIERKYYEMRLKLADDFAEEQHKMEILRMENEMNAMEENSRAYIDKRIELKAFELKTLTQMETESDEQFYARKLQAEKAYLDAKEVLVERQISIMESLSTNTATIFDTLAEIYESDEENSEANAKHTKALRIAAATIDTISGAISAFMQCVKTYKPPQGAIIGGVQAAAVTAAGVAQIAKMKSVTTSGSASISAPAVTTAPATMTEIPQIRNLTSASEEDRLNLMTKEQRVVLVMSDLEAKQNQTRVQVAESSF